MITAKQVKELAELKCISLNEAKKQLEKLHMMQQVNEAKTVNDLKPILLKLIDS